MLLEHLQRDDIVWHSHIQWTWGVSSPSLESHFFNSWFASWVILLSATVVWARQASTVNKHIKMKQYRIWIFYSSELRIEKHFCIGKVQIDKHMFDFTLGLNNQFFFLSHQPVLSVRGIPALCAHPTQRRQASPCFTVIVRILSDGNNMYNTPNTCKPQLYLSFCLTNEINIVLWFDCLWFDTSLDFHFKAGIKVISSCCHSNNSFSSKLQKCTLFTGSSIMSKNFQAESQAWNYWN